MTPLRNWLVEEVLTKSAMLSTCWTFYLEFKSDAERIYRVWLARPKFSQIERLAANAICVNQAYTKTHVQAGKDIDKLAGHVLRILGAEFRKTFPDHAHGQETSVVQSVLVCHLFVSEKIL